MGRALMLAMAIATALPGCAWAHSVSSPAVSSVTITRSRHSGFGGPFSLIDQDGRALSSADFRGTTMLIYFGYTNCADACPLDTQAMSIVVDALDRRGIAVAPLFITVDPARDTPGRLKEFLAPFGSRIIGLTGAIDYRGEGYDGLWRLGRGRPRQAKAGWRLRRVARSHCLSDGAKRRVPRRHFLEGPAGRGCSADHGFNRRSRSASLMRFTGRAVLCYAPGSAISAGGRQYCSVQA